LVFNRNDNLRDRQPRSVRRTAMRVCGVREVIKGHRKREQVQVLFGNKEIARGEKRSGRKDARDEEEKRETQNREERGGAEGEKKGEERRRKYTHT